MKVPIIYVYKHEIPLPTPHHYQPHNPVLDPLQKDDVHLSLD